MGMAGDDGLNTEITISHEQGFSEILGPLLRQP